MEVRVAGRGRTIRAVCRLIRSSSVRESPVVGSVPFSRMYASISRRS